MNDRAVWMEKIFQKDNETFVIEWSDGIVDAYPLSKVQRECPCAGCFENREKGALAVDDRVRAEKISSVGRYAVRIQFTAGCSAGIYDYPLLRKVARN